MRLSMRVPARRAGDALIRPHTHTYTHSRGQRKKEARTSSYTVDAGIYREKNWKKGGEAVSGKTLETKTKKRKRKQCRGEMEKKREA